MAPSNRHKELARRCFPWVASRATKRGIRGAYEVPLTLQWVTDVAILASFQHQYFASYTGGVEVFGYWLMIFEVKVARSDFASTFKATGTRHAINRQTGFGNLHWVVTESGLVKPDEVPEQWGILECRGSGLCETRRPILHGIGELRKAEVAETILWKLPAPSEDDHDD